MANKDIYWYVGSTLDALPEKLPQMNTSLSGSSIVPWRYHFNTVTFSYTTAFWSWSDWELQLDWMALHGINLPLAWVGVEKIYLDVFVEMGLSEDEVMDFFSGPAFQAWNRMGNIQGSWGGNLPLSWIESQHQLQLKIVKRMVELGMTPVLPAFSGFVPRAFAQLYSSNTTNGSQWNEFPTKFTNDSFLSPNSDLFAEIQERFIKKQIQVYGNVTNVYALDQYNENDPYSGELSYLEDISYSTWKSLKSANPDAKWLMQGWLFFSNSEFWTDSRVKAYLSGVADDDDLIILDLFSESEPQWQRTNSYFGKPWIWCMLHDYGGNMGLYGQILNVTNNPIEALANSSSLIGFGLTPEGQEGNEIMYDLLLDQAWSSMPINTAEYFRDWVTTRYSCQHNISIPTELYSAWDILRNTVYNNTNLTSASSVTKSIIELQPSTEGLVNRTGHHATTINYEPEDLIEVWNLMRTAAIQELGLWECKSFEYDLVDVTRQVLQNSFVPLYNELVAGYNTSGSGQKLSKSSLANIGDSMLSILWKLDSVLSTNENFALSTWLADAQMWAFSNTSNSSSISSFYNYNARNQITLWGPKGEISDYASRSWGGLVSSYYMPRWKIFVDYILENDSRLYNDTILDQRLLSFEEAWQMTQYKDFLHKRSKSTRSEGLKSIMDTLEVPGMEKLK